MGAKQNLVKLLGGILVFQFCWAGVQAQIVIKEKVEIHPEQSLNLPPVQKNIAGPGDYYHPVLHRLEKGTYLVLKSGELKFYFEEAQSYGIEMVEDHVLKYAITAPSTQTVDSLKVFEFLNGPIKIKEGADNSCRETQTYFDSTLTYGIGPTDDTWIYHSHPDNPPNSNNYGDDIRFHASRHLNPQTHPDSASRTAYLQFGINQLETNAQLDSAHLNLTAVPSSTDPIGSSDPEGHLRLYKVNGPWTEQTLTFANRPSTNLADVITVTPNDMQEIDGVGYDYSKSVFSFVDDWLNNGLPDYGIRISSDSGHVFVSKESFYESASGPSISLHLSSAKRTDNRSINMGYVQAGDTLRLEYMGLSDNFRPTFTNNPVNADDRLSFSKYSRCQTHTFLNLLPHIEEDTPQSSYFEFTLSNELSLPSDGQGFQDMYIEPNILFDNGSSGLPGWIFLNYFASLHEVSPVYIPEGTPGLPAGMIPVALMDGSPNGLVSFSPYNTGTTIEYMSHPLARGKTFKLVVAGAIRKGVMVGKANSKSPDSPDILQAIQDTFSEAYPELSVASANCDLNPFGDQQEGLFVSCFEFTIGEDALDITIELPDPGEVWPTVRTIDGGNPDNQNSTNLSVIVTQNEEPVASHEVQISIHFVQGTAGHDHTGHDFPVDLSGTLRNIHTGEEAEGVLTTQTGDNGQIELEYTASPFSGKFEVMVESNSGNSSMKDTLFVKVPNLLSFQGEGSYQLTGSTIQHPNNHFIISQQAISSLLNISNAFADASWNSTGQMRLNDMSLEWGGLFDITGEWEVPHRSHRTGRNVDIENVASIDTTVIVNGNERTIRVFSVDWINRYQILMNIENWRFIDEEQKNPFRENPRLRYPHFNWEGN